MNASLTQVHRRIIAIRGDTQGGHAGGLLNPETRIPDMGIDPITRRKVVKSWRHPTLSPVQQQLWDWHMEDIGRVQDLAAGDEIVFIEMGDLTQGNIFKDDLAETGMLSQVIISHFGMQPWLQLANLQKVYIVKGTGVHVWGEGATETLLTMMLGYQYQDARIQIADHWLLDVDGFLLDVAHHGPGAGIRNWTKGNAFELYAKSVMMDEIDLGNRVPDALLRAHKHEFIYRRPIHQVREKIWEMPAFIAPPYCFIGSHAQKVMNSPAFMGVGVLALEIINGRLHAWHPFTHFVDLRTEEYA